MPLLCVTYHKYFVGMPEKCDRCGDLLHSVMLWTVGRWGLVTQRHNIVRESDDKNDLTALVAELGVSGVWQPQTMALLDIRVVDTDDPSHIN